jgi:hypothetical protein
MTMTDTSIKVAEGAEAKQAAAVGAVVATSMDRIL